MKHLLKFLDDYFALGIILIIFSTVLAGALVAILKGHLLGAGLLLAIAVYPGLFLIVSLLEPRR